MSGLYQIEGQPLEVNLTKGQAYYRRWRYAVCHCGEWMNGHDYGGYNMMPHTPTLLEVPKVYRMAATA